MCAIFCENVSNVDLDEVRGLAAEVMIINGKAQLIRARQSYEDLMRGEHLLDA